MQTPRLCCKRRSKRILGRECQWIIKVTTDQPRWNNKGNPDDRRQDRRSRCSNNGYSSSCSIKLVQYLLSKFKRCKGEPVPLLLLRPCDHLSNFRNTRETSHILLNRDSTNTLVKLVTAHLKPLCHSPSAYPLSNSSSSRLSDRI